MSEYVEPRNAVSELFSSVSRDLLPVLVEECRKIRENDSDDDTWPDAPYHYGMGRIREYDDWLHSLSVEDQEKEIAAGHARYEEQNDRIATLLIARMKELSHDITDQTKGRNTLNRSQGSRKRGKKLER